MLSTHRQLSKSPIDLMSGNFCLIAVVASEIHFHIIFYTSVNVNLIWRQITTLTKGFRISYYCRENLISIDLSHWKPVFSWPACKGQWRTAFWRKWTEHLSRAHVFHSCLSGLVPVPSQWLLQKGNLRGQQWGSEHGAEGHLLPKNCRSVRSVYNYTSHPHAAGLLEHSVP